MEITTAPLTAASRGVALWLGATVVVLAALSAAGYAKPAFPNEPAVVAATFAIGAAVAGIGIARREPRRAAAVWIAVNVALGVGAVAGASWLGLA